MARKAWDAACKKTDPETIIAEAMEYAASPVGKGEFVKGPAPWLNQECWDDERAAWNRDQTANGKANGNVEPSNGQPTVKPMTDAEKHTDNLQRMTPDQRAAYCQRFGVREEDYL